MSAFRSWPRRIAEPSPRTCMRSALLGWTWRNRHGAARLGQDRSKSAPTAAGAIHRSRRYRCAEDCGQAARSAVRGRRAELIGRRHGGPGTLGAEDAGPLERRDHPREDLPQPPVRAAPRGIRTNWTRPAHSRSSSRSGPPRSSAPTRRPIRGSSRPSRPLDGRPRRGTTSGAVRKSRSGRGGKGVRRVDRPTHSEPPPVRLRRLVR
jgi:hypothetical protein